MAELSLQFNDVVKTNNAALESFAATLHTEIRNRIAKENKGETIDPQFSVVLPLPMKPNDVRALTAAQQISHYCAIPSNDYGIKITSQEDAAGTIISTKLTVDINLSYRSSGTEVVKPGEKARSSLSGLSYG